MKAIWNNKIIAESNNTVVIENNHYFPIRSVDKSLLSESDYITRCPWKGIASYYNLEVNGSKNENAAWYYPEPSDAAQEIKGMVAFWKGVEITE